MVAWVYYQTVEDSRQTWQLAPVEKLPELVGSIYHLSIYQLAKTPEEAEQGNIRYAGDLWLDIDHKAGPGETDDAALERAIVDLKRAIAYFQSIEVKLSDLEFYATGGKGFHVRIPGQLFGGSGMFKYLPLIHKYMAYQIEQLAGLEGMDGGLYCLGKGRLLRQPNMPRPGDRYKVPIPAEIAVDITVPVYRLMTSQPRSEGLLPKNQKFTVNTSLALLFEEGRQDALDQRTPRPVDTELLESFGDKVPVCIQWLCDKRNIKDGIGQFNGAKMGLARYLGALGVTGPHPLIEQFAQHWESDRNPSYDSRVRAVQYALKYGKEQGFSCDKVLLSLNKNPCQGCPVQLAQFQEAAELQGFEEMANGYFKRGTKGALTEMSNFTLRPTAVYISAMEDEKVVRHDFNVFAGALPDKGQAKNNFSMEFDTWSNLSRFRNVINKIPGLHWLGSDGDLQRLRSYLTGDTMTQGLRKMKLVRTVGVHKHEEPARGINEFVWVQDGWSVNAAGVADTVRFEGVRQDFNGAVRSISLDFRNISNQATEQTYDALAKLFEVNDPGIVAIVTGWCAACWLKPHLMHDSTELHFPLLQLCGSATSGKTLTAKMFSVLGGADYSSIGALTAPTATAFAYKQEASLTSSVPRVIDEINPHKIPNKYKYAEIIEVLKACASGGLLMQGRISVDKGGTVLDTRPATSPIIFCATQVSNVKEIDERSVTLDLSLKTRQGRQITPAERVKKHLYPLVKQLMLASLTIDEAQVFKWMQEADYMLPEQAVDRLLRNYQVVLTGLRFLHSVMVQHSYPQKLVDRVKRMQTEVVEYLSGPVLAHREQSTRTEVDVILDTMGELALSNGNTPPILSLHFHYAVEGELIHLHLALCFSAYQMSVTRMGRTPELQTVEQMLRLLEHQPYYVGKSVYDKARDPEEYVTLNLHEMRRVGIMVSRFTGVLLQESA